MAMIKAINTNYGVDAQYWMIAAAAEDYRARSIETIVFGYATPEARRTGKEPLAIAKIIINGDKYSPDMNRREMYAALLTFDQFLNAGDDSAPAAP